MADKCINSNPDIAGIGIRFNFYITVLVTILTRENEYTEELLCGIYKNSVINGLGLILTAVIQTMQGKLDLYHATFLMYILFILNFVLVFGERKFVWSSQTNFQMSIYLSMHAFSLIVFFIWFLYAQIEGGKFGSQPSCNRLVIFVYSFINLKATATWFRVILVLWFAIVIPFFLVLLGFLLFAPTRSKQVYTNAIQRQFDKYPWLKLARYMIGIPLAVNIIVNLELTAHRNSPIIQPGENDWGFGQIIAVILTLGIFIDMATAFREWHRMKHHRLKNSEY